MIARLKYWLWLLTDLPTVPKRSPIDNRRLVARQARNRLIREGRYLTQDDIDQRRQQLSRWRF